MIFPLGSLFGYFGAIGRYFLPPEVQINYDRSKYGRLKSYKYALLLSVKIINKTIHPVLLEQIDVVFKDSFLEPMPIGYPSLPSILGDNGWFVLERQLDSPIELPYRIEPMTPVKGFTMLGMPNEPEIGHYSLSFSVDMKFHRRRGRSLQFELPALTNAVAFPPFEE